jgi:hypothetical protein
MTKLGILLIAALVACKAKELPPRGDQTGSEVAAPARGSGSAAGSAAGAPATGTPGETASDTADDMAHRGPGYNLTGPRPHQAANCPSSLPRATTRLANTPRGVDVTVTSPDPVTAHRIVELSQLHVRGRTAEVPRAHDQHHGGPGWVGYCPVMVNDQTQISMTPRPDGATLHVEARSPERVSELQMLIKARAVRLPGYLSS